MKKLKVVFIIITILLLGCNKNTSEIKENQNLTTKKIDTQKEKKKQITWQKNKYFYVKDIPFPKDFERVGIKEGDFAHFLRNFSLKTESNTVYLYNGQEKPNQSAQYAVLDLSVGEKDLQQCADAIMRLRGEFLYSKKEFEKLHFNFTNGQTAYFEKYTEGFRPRLRENGIEWQKTAKKSNSYDTFIDYMEVVFTYAGTLSLEKELEKTKLEKMQIGDVFIQGGSPGHAVLVMDMAKHKTTGEKIFLLAQSYMPAQDVHILLNPGNKKLSPWYSLSDLSDSHFLITPEWEFEESDLKRFN